MKLVSSQYLVLKLEAGRSEWSINVPPGLIQCKEDEQLKIYVKKAIIRNDFPVIYEGRDFIEIEDETIYLRHGSPNSLSLVEELNKKTILEWSFDTYNGKLYVSNTKNRTIRFAARVLNSVLGFNEAIDLEPGDTIEAPRGIDLAPPESVLFRMVGLSSASLEILQEGDVKNADLLCVIGMDVSPYQTKVFKHSEADFSHYLQQKVLSSIVLNLEDSDALPLASSNPITMVLAIERWRDDEKELVQLNRERNELARLSLLGQSISDEKTSE